MCCKETEYNVVMVYKTSICTIPCFNRSLYSNTRSGGGDVYSLHKGHKSGPPDLQLLPTAGTHAVKGYTLHMNTASVTYTLKGALIGLPNWKVAWLGHTW